MKPFQETACLTMLFTESRLNRLSGVDVLLSQFENDGGVHFIILISWAEYY
jgi:hypothetical protein